MTKQLLNLDTIWKFKDTNYEDVFVPEWNGTVRVKGLTGKGRDAFEASLTTQKRRKVKMNISNVRARLLVRTIVDENNELLFKTSDAEALGQKSAAALDRIFTVAKQLSGMTDEDMEEMTEDLQEA